MNETLLPCPFCGSSIVGELTESSNPHDTLGVVGCGVCGCNGPSLFEPGEFVARWNERADPPITERWLRQKGYVPDDDLCFTKDRGRLAVGRNDRNSWSAYLINADGFDGSEDWLGDLTCREDLKNFERLLFKRADRHD